jgi:Na+-translocating ferredoxin:NAD+ oxidoreductase subunit D
MKKHEFETKEGPHQFTFDSKKRIMWFFVLALIPVIVFSIHNFGIYVLLIISVSIISAMLTDALFNFIRKKPIRFFEGSSFITGLLLAMTLSPTVPLWIPILGSFIAISIGKQIFGGVGCAIFNPALVGRAFLGISFGGIVNNYVWPDGITSATPLGVLQQSGTSSVYEIFGNQTLTYLRLFTGNISGSIGETSAFLLLIGGILLITYKIIDWRIPFYYIGTVFLLTFFAGQDPFIHVLSGGLFLGAFYMATGYEGIPVTSKGRIFASILLGILTVSIRLLGSLPEGVAFSILMVNAATPMIDRFTILKPFGLIKIKEFNLFKKKIIIKKTY